MRLSQRPHDVTIPSSEYNRGSRVHYSLDNSRIYYNIQIGSGGGSGPSYSIAQFQENRTQPLLDNPCDYYLTVIRFSIPGDSIPIQVVPILANQGDPNKTTCSVTLSQGGVDVQVYLQYVCDDLTLTAPQQNADGTWPATDYYFSYNYQQFIDMMNIALDASYTTLAPAGPYNNGPPYFEYDPVTQLISLYAPANWADVGAPQIWVNTALGKYIIGLYQIFDSNGTNGKNQKIVVEDKGGTNAYYPPGSLISTTAAGNVSSAVAPWLKMTQDFVAIQYWNSFKTIVFTSGTLPISNEYIPAGTSNYNSGAIAFRPVITDFEPLLASGGDARSVLQYYQQGPYRLVDMKGNVPLSKIDVQVFWSDFQDNLFPIYITGDNILTIKMLFIRKDSVTGSDYKAY